MRPFAGIRPRADGPVEPRGRLFSNHSESTDLMSGIPITQAMEILERIAERKALQVGVPLGFADRIQVLP